MKFGKWRQRNFEEKISVKFNNSGAKKSEEDKKGKEEGKDDVDQ